MTDQFKRAPTEGDAAPVTAARAEEIGADGYGANAGMAVERAKELAE